MTLYRTDFRKLIWLSVIVALLTASMLMGCSSGGSDAPGTEDFTGLIQESGILISSTDTIPTKRIVEFHNLVMVSQFFSQHPRRDHEEYGCVCSQG